MSVSEQGMYLFVGYACLVAIFPAYVLFLRVRDRRPPPEKPTHVFRHGVSEHKTVTAKPDGTVVEEYAYLSLNIPEKV